MGVIYSTSEVFFGRVPVNGAHLHAATQVAELVPRLDGVDLTVVHGSVVNGTSNTRSDLDVLVTYSHQTPSCEPAVVRTINNTLDALSSDTGVKIEANVWPTNEHVLARRERMHDILFSRHLARSMHSSQWSIGEPDQRIIDIAEASYGDEELLRKVALNYTTYKHSGFTKAPRAYSESERVLSALQRAFEFPKAIGRKIGQLAGYDHESTPAENWSMLVDSGLNGETHDALTQLYTLDAEYSDMLRDLSNNSNRHNRRHITQYQEWLRTTYPAAINLGIIAATGFTNFVAEGKNLNKV